MNVGEVAVKNAPTVYLCMSSDKDVIAKADKEVPWGYEAIGKRIQLSESSSGPEQAELVQHFLKLKERDGFYGILPASLTVTPGTDGACSVTGKLELPAKIPPVSTMYVFIVSSANRSRRTRPGGCMSPRRASLLFLLIWQ